MALLNLLRRRAWNCDILTCTRKSGLRGGHVLGSKSFFVEAEDALDAFTTQLLRKKSDKWESLNASRMVPAGTAEVSCVKAAVHRVEYLTVKEVDDIFQGALDVFDKSKVALLLEECIAHGKCPSVSVLVNIVSFFAQRADVDGVNGVYMLCKHVYPEFVAMNSNFQHYLAEAVWLRGNVTKAIGLFDSVYRTNPFLRRRIRITLRYLISESLLTRSEAVLVLIKNFCRSLFRQHKDSYLLQCLWQVCFLSEWHADQCIALELMEENHTFCKTVLNHVPYVVAVSLKHHRTEPVYRLLEVLLKFDFKMQCSIVLVALFDYRYRQGNLLCCLEIYNWSTKHNLALPTVQHEKFLYLLLNQGDVSAPSRQTQAPCHLKF